MHTVRRVSTPSDEFKMINIFQIGVNPSHYYASLVEASENKEDRGTSILKIGVHVSLCFSQGGIGPRPTTAQTSRHT